MNANGYPAMITGEWLGDEHPGYPALVVDHWNGWAVPLFTREVTERIVRENSEVLRWDGDDVVCSTEDLDEPERYTADAAGLYPVGGGSWTWDELGDPPAVIHLSYETPDGDRGVVAGWFASEEEAQPRINSLRDAGYSVHVDRIDPNASDTA
jgi:hypothetical protein